MDTIKRLSCPASSGVKCNKCKAIYDIEGADLATVSPRTLYGTACCYPGDRECLGVAIKAKKVELERGSGMPHIAEMPEAPDAPWVAERWHVKEDGTLHQGEKRPPERPVRKHVYRDILYSHLADILNEAFQFAAEGKGHERHGTAGQPWTDQRHVHIGKEFGTGFALGQAAKKMGESQRLPTDRAVRELLGAITYIASAIHLRRSEDDV
jgi:hypothetical protein